MPDKAELKRRRAQSQRDKARNRQEEQAEAQAESRRRRAQSEKDKARSRREKEEEISIMARATQRQLVLDLQSSLPTIIPERHPSTTSLVGMKEKRSAEFMTKIARMFNDTRYSDATVVIYGKNLPIHKSVVCTQSKYLEKAFQDSFVEGSSGVLTFNNDSEAAYWRVFEYLYTGDYPDDLLHDIEDDPALLKEPRVYALAEMFFLEDLKAVAVAKLQQKLQDLWTSDSFPECIQEIYATTPENDVGMRSAVVEIAKVHVKELISKDIFKDLIREGGDFAVEYFESVVSPPAPATFSALRPRGALFVGTRKGSVPLGGV
ncbi:hypothetical protein J3E71DRAFT_187155 [Bipolaris maydis]|nr:hypothetical protein J3E71DRAFT_187155 [Bipolaris maydis]